MKAPDLRAPEFVRAEAAAHWCVRLCEGEMTSAARAEFTRWLSSDPLNRAAFDQAVATWEDVNAAEATAELVSLRVEALESLRRAQRARAGWLWHRTRAPGVLAAAVVVAILGAVGVWRQLSPQEFSSGVGERRTVVLADGSRISLDASSEVLVRYSKELRTLQLARGRAKFEVAKDPRRPFQVHAADREIVATGTAFSVEIVQKEVRVVLYQGRVSVAGRGPSIALAAGQELIAPISAAQTSIEPADIARSLAWESGELEFVNEPLASAVERVNRYSVERVSVGDTGAANVRISGAFTAGDTRAFVEGVTAVSPLRAEDRDGRIVLWSSEDGAH
jgi:transmembrane sensor